MMIIILTKDVYSEIVKVDGELKEALCMAMANLTMAKQLIFDIVSKRKMMSISTSMSRKPCVAHLLKTTSMRWIQ